MDSTAAVLPDEVALVARAVTDPAAFAAIYDHYFPRIYTYVAYRVSSSEMADDLTAKVFERALVHIDRFRPERAPFAAWLFAIARHAVINHLRAQKRHRWLSLDVLHRHPTNDPLPEETAVRNETRAELLTALAKLKQREQDIIALRFAGGLSYRHIAQLTGLSESNVGVILYRAVRKLRAELSSKGENDERK
jgi:RNA polymerase sigma-70 factor (ECF subfamily)